MQDGAGPAVTAKAVGEVFSFVIEELTRLQRLGAAVTKELKGLEFTCMLHDVEGRMRLIGRPAYDRLRGLVVDAVGQSEHRGCLDLDRTFRVVRAGFGRDILRADFKGTTDAEDLALLQGWIEEAAAECRPLTHYIPCHIRLPQEQTFVVGPVTFTPKALAIAEVEASLAQWAAGEDDDAAWREKDRRTTLDYLEAFSDVARVTVQRCDPETSRRVAHETVQGALAFLHVMGGADRTSKVRSAGPAVQNAQRSTLAFDAEGKPFLTWTGDWEGARLDKSFWRWIQEEAQQAMALAVGLALQKVADRVDPPMLAARYLDAAAWYADAATETRRPAAVVKYLTAMERLLWTGEKGGVTRRLSERAAALCFTIDPWNFEVLGKEIRRAYDLRSAIVHGRIDNDDPKIVRNYRLCDRVARDLLMTWLRRYGAGFDREVTLEGLRDHLDWFVAEAVKETAARLKAG
ncbi:hypothetical protein DDF67_09800 [Caulobacter endophyticus]|uniref:Uncharacterized protein n=2 Tax=Caulobacter endophyticus TaxID=2172652 RepID=A0A2T9K408_9CAUL|nr:HEPN domain-containing protein [Caulobacter endophyticus]PVM90709.1 hypothetical protein DDF67_09800 [Caulobacter endophyticus]